MRPATGFHRNEARRQLAEERQHLIPRQLLARHNPARGDPTLLSIAAGGMSRHQIDALDPACGRLGLALGVAVALAAVLALAG